MTRFTQIVLLALVFVLEGCAIHPPAPTLATEMCAFQLRRIEVPLPGPANAATTALEEGTQELPSLAADIRTALNSGSRDPGVPPLAVLALSGGGEHGAFGAGFLHGWRLSRPDQRLPEFGVVTGISTGSILATFAFIGDTERGVERYSITNESQLLTPVYHARPDGRMSPTALISIARRGAVADLAPLRIILRTEVSPEVLAEVARRHALGRKLYVGAVDVDTGQAVAMDLTEMATRYVAAAGPDSASGETLQQARIRDCYVSAIVASSSAPLAAIPVFIDNRMYVDGGARFGMFSDDVVEGVAGHDKDSGQRSQIYLIANGDLETSVRCGKADATLCQPPNPPSGGAAGAHRDWSLIDLALRSESILVNQVYRFSADRVISQGKLTGDVLFARIDTDALSHPFTMNAPVLGSGTQTCAQWQAMDRETMHPLQFYPRYMRCLIDYGQGRGARTDWDNSPTHNAVAPPPATP